MKQSTHFFQFKTNIKFIIILIVGLQTSAILAQNKKMIRKANSLFLFSKFNQALPLYLDLLKEDPNSFLYNYRT